MPATCARRRQSDPAVISIKAHGAFPGAFPEHFGGFSIEALPTLDGSLVTEITGPVADQTALLSLLQYLDDTGLVLISVEAVDPTAQRAAVESSPSGGYER